MESNLASGHRLGAGQWSKLTAGPLRGNSAERHRSSRHPVVMDARCVCTSSIHLEAAILGSFEQKVSVSVEKEEIRAEKMLMIGRRSKEKALVVMLCFFN